MKMLRWLRLPNKPYEDLQIFVYRQGSLRKEWPLLFETIVGADHCV